MGQDHQKPLNAETDDWVFSSGISLGALLRQEREKKGLTYAQISQQTRMRPHFIEAIENGDWDLLPAPTLVKGFIKSYARVLALDEERLLDLYREESGADDFSQKFVLPSVAQKKIWPYVVVGLLLLLAAASAYYAWLFLPDMKGAANTDSVKVQRLPDGEKPLAPERQEKTEPVTVIEENAPQTADSESDLVATAEHPEVPEKPRDLEGELPKPAVSRNLQEEKPELEVPAAAVETESLKLHLKGFVTERTWLRISIDGMKPKEYVFGPSDMPEWQAEKGFELLIGNAGGIALEFNGKKMDNLGKQGQVIRIKLPENEERSSEEN
ncbi:MAG: helix-turn-helix domain-containing protein [Deltaproteobacteria bacterium]|jgi:cytoskeletal protein RodZ|nr:helix-turn-helix domain-containing protein [Deltaproteobacteria bacterium]